MATDRMGFPQPQSERKPSLYLSLFYAWRRSNNANSIANISLMINPGVSGDGGNTSCLYNVFVMPHSCPQVYKVAGIQWEGVREMAVIENLGDVKYYVLSAHCYQRAFVSQLIRFAHNGALCVMA